MKVTIVYDSIFGNTAQVAGHIAAGIGREHDVVMTMVQAASELRLSETDLLIVGSPTRGFQPTPQITEFVAGLGPIPPAMLGAAFDTRLDLDTVNPPALRWVMEVGGYASTRLAGALAGRGITMRGDPGGFCVTGSEGPLKEGELERARQWASGLVSSQSRDPGAT